MRLLTAGRVLGPGLRQIEPIGNRQARIMIGDRERHHHLTIGLFAQLPAILMVHTDGVRALLGKRGIVDDPGLDRAVTLEPRHHHLAHLGQNSFVRPHSLADEMQKLLMLRRNRAWRRRRRHRLDTLAALRHQ